MNAYTQNPDTPAQCPRCGRRVLLSSLRPQVVAGRPTALWVCAACLDEDNQQLLLGRIRVSDSQVVHDPSPPDDADVGPDFSGETSVVIREDDDFALREDGALALREDG